jgi:hypothetical protein
MGLTDGPGSGGAREPIWGPTDVLAVGDRERVPDLSTFVASLDEYIQAYDRALAGGAHRDRVQACWGLVACGALSLPWCETTLRGDDVDAIEDAVGIVGCIGLPAEWLTWIEERVDSATDDGIVDLLWMLLPEATAKRLSLDSPSDVEPVTSGELLGGAFDPFTDIIYFIAAPYQEVLDVQSPEARRAYLTKLAPLDRSEHRGRLADLLGLLEPQSYPGWKKLWVETAKDWTAVFSQGSDLSFISAYADFLAVRVVRTSWGPHVVRNGRIARYGGTSLWIWDPVVGDPGPPSEFGPAPTYLQTRTLQASRQSSRWEWDDDGDPLPFEDVARYDQPRVKDRFTVDSLNDYCRHLGIERADESFYGPRATLEVKDITTWRQPPRSMPSAQWRADNR